MKITHILENLIYYGTQVPIIKQANALRKEMTDAEIALWAKIRRRQISGYKFRRQHAISQFIADFYCHEKKLVIEVDGGYHNDPLQMEHDQQRTFELEKFGLSVLRFSNDEINNKMTEVIRKIREFLETH
jgi:very-short-patch-repair endonuclease